MSNKKSSILRVVHYVVKLPRAPEFPEKLAVEGGLCSPSHFRPKHVCLRVSSNSSCLGMGYPSNSVMGKEEKHKIAQEGGGKSWKCLQQKKARSSARESSSVGRGCQPQLPQVLWAGCCESPLWWHHLCSVCSFSCESQVRVPGFAWNSIRDSNGCLIFPGGFLLLDVLSTY